VVAKKHRKENMQFTFSAKLTLV